MRVRLEYGKDGLVAEIPDKNLVAVLGLSTPPPLEDVESAILNALRNPIGNRGIGGIAREFARQSGRESGRESGGQSGHEFEREPGHESGRDRESGIKIPGWRYEVHLRGLGEGLASSDPIGPGGGDGSRTACIVVCDVTRPVPNPVLLPPILRELEGAGIPASRVTILIATGTHRPNVGEELVGMLGREVVERCRIVNHVCTDSASHAFLGTSPNGVPVWIDRTYLEADVKITVGLIEPHFMAGYSGGRKLIMPGIMALETVQAWHSPRFLEHPNATAGVVDGNPVHEEALSIAKMAPPDMIVDVTLDEQNRITGVFVGELDAAWREGVRFAESAVRAPLAEPVDIVVTTCAGAPLDATFYQAVKGMVGALPIVKPGGSIVIAAACSEGVGSEDFIRTLLETEDLSKFVEDIQRPDWVFIPDQWEVEELARATLRNEVYCVCKGIPRVMLEQLFVTPADSVEAGVAMALEKHGPDATIAVIPKGPYVIPYVLIPM